MPNRLMGLLVNCPCCKSLPECPLYPYRQLDLKIAWELVSKFTDEEVHRVLIYHRRCENESV